MQTTLEAWLLPTLSISWMEWGGIRSSFFMPVPPSGGSSSGRWWVASFGEAKSNKRNPERGRTSTGGFPSIGVLVGDISPHFVITNDDEQIRFSWKWDYDDMTLQKIIRFINDYLQIKPVYCRCWGEWKLFSCVHYPRLRI